MEEKDFNPETMKRATEEDVIRMWNRLWGNATVLWILGQFDDESGEYLDLTQTMRVGGGASHRSHKSAQSVATTEPATKV
jgi:hypothetical protein